MDIFLSDRIAGEEKKTTEETPAPEIYAIRMTLADRIFTGGNTE